MTNPIRRRAEASLRNRGEAWAARLTRYLEVTAKGMPGLHHVFGGGMFGRQDD
jgi:hypothetical protein